MSTQAWPSLSDPRQLVQIGLARVRLGESVPGGAPPSALAWQQRMEDALRCARLGDGQRLVLIRKLQVRTGSALAPGWSEVVQAAAQDLVSRAWHGRHAGADRAEAVWFESWDDAVAAWLDVALGVGSPELSEHAWYWSRIARMAGLPAPLAGSASGGASPGFGSMSTRDEQARAMWARWQADPISRRACKAWSAQRPGVLNRLAGLSQAPELNAPEASGQPMRAGDAAHSHQAFHDEPVPGWAVDEAHLPSPVHPRPSPSDAAMAQVVAPEMNAGREAAAHGVRAQVTREMQEPPEPHKTHAPQDRADAASTQAPSSVPDGLARHARSGPSASAHTGGSSTAWQAEAPAQPQDLVHGDRPQASSGDTHLKPDRVDPTGPREPSPQSLPASMAEALSPTFRALGWTHLRFTQLGGLPFTVRALQGLGFAHALKALVPTQEGFDERLAASAPWLHLWARLGPHARQQCLRDPMFAALPAFERVEDLPLQAQAPALLACWLAQPQSVQSLGRQAWHSLDRAMRHKGWRRAIDLLQRPAWMQLSSTHLDVLFTLDQADLNVRRLGLDADPGWVPWLGRIVNLHFEPAQALPPCPLDRSTP